MTHGYGIAAGVRYPYQVPTHFLFLLNLQFWHHEARMEAWEAKNVLSPQPKKESQNKYCHTHGLCAHTSKDCRSPDQTTMLRQQQKTPWVVQMQSAVRGALGGLMVRGGTEEEWLLY